VKYSSTRHELEIAGKSLRYTWVDVFTLPVEITTGRPCYDQKKGLKINHNQSIATFFSKVFPNPIQANLSREMRLDQSSPFQNVASTSVAVGQGDTEPDLLISFMRTVRIPEDKKNHALPPGLGRFPLFDVRPFAHRLPPSLAAQGGMFIPMYRKSYLHP
jgi:hypothetical protein